MEGNKKWKRPTIPIPLLRKPARSWVRSTSEKSILFTEHLANIFTKYFDKNNDDIEVYLNAACQLSLPVIAFNTF
jgi:hypothetical protein